MSRILGRWTWPAVGASAIGVAVSNGGSGSAEPIPQPLTPLNVSAPRGEPVGPDRLREGADTRPVTPAGAVVPTIPSVTLPSLPPAPVPIGPRANAEPPADVPVIPPLPPLPVPPPAPVPVVPPPATDLAPAPHPILIEPETAPAPRPVTPVIPAPVVAAPVIPAPAPVIPAPAPTPVIPAPAPVIPSPVVPDPVAPPVQPAKSADPVQPAPPAQPDFNLRPAPPGLTLNSGRPAPVEPAIPAASGKGLPPEVVAAPRPVETRPAPAALTSAPPPTLPEDPPVTLAPRQLALTAAVGFALASAPLTPVQAGAAEPPAKAEVDELKKEIADLKADLKRMKNSRDEMEILLYGSSGKDGPAVKGLATKMSDVELKLANIAEALKRIDDKLDKMPRTVGSSPLTGTPPAATRGYVKLVNDYPVDVSIVLNGKSYRLTPGEVRTVDVPVGSYTYELLSAGSQPTTSTVRDAETVTLRIR